MPYMQTHDRPRLFYTDCGAGRPIVFVASRLAGLSHVGVPDPIPGSGEIVRYLTRHGSARVARIAIISGTTPCLTKRADNPDGIDLELVEAGLATRTADRPKWFADNAAASMRHAISNSSAIVRSGPLAVQI